MIDLDELRIKQINFEGKRLDYAKREKKLERRRLAFIKKFPIDEIIDLSLDEYIIGKESQDSFCYLIERELEELGNIKGITPDRKFGIFFKKRINNYSFAKRYGENKDEAFLEIKAQIRNLLVAGRNKNIDDIKDNVIAPVFKGKLLSTYFPQNYLCIFSKPHLNHFLESLDINYDYKYDEIDKRTLLLDFKNNDEIMKNWSIFEYMKFLYDNYGFLTNKDKLPKDLLEYKDLKADYPKMKNVKPEVIDLVIIPKNIESSEKTRIFKGKIDFERENRIKRNLGKRGEEIVVKFENESLQKINREDLADKIEWVSQEDDSLGYDIITYDEEGKKKFIEVKATTNSPSLSVNFIISNNQYRVAQKTNNYYFYIVFNAKSKNPKVWKIKNPIKHLDKGLTLTPISYRVIINTEDNE